MEIRTSSVSFQPLKGSGPRPAQATVVFPRVVLSATAALTNYSVGFAGDDHHFGNLQLMLDTVVNAEAVIVTVTFGLRDWSGDWDDSYQGTVEFAVIAELASATAPPPRTDVIIADAEFNQATQFFQSYRHLDPGTVMPDNALRLIGGKNTGVRLYVDYDVSTTTPITSLSGSLRITTPSGATTVLSPIADIAPIPQVAIDRGNVAQTLNFMIPGVWCHDQLTLEAVVFDGSPIVVFPVAPSAVPTSVPYGRTIRFLDSVPLQIFGVGIHYTGQGLDLPAPTQADLIATLDMTERVYPVGEALVAGFQTHDFSGDLKPSDDGDDTPGFDSLLDILEELRGGGGEPYVALLPTGGIDTTIDTTGWLIGGKERNTVAASFNGDGSSLAHEIGHAYGRDHTGCDDSARCDDPDSPDDDYPHYGVYASDSIGEYGYDPIANQVFDPAATFDFMGYSQPAWTSPYTYAALMAALPPTGGGPTGSPVSRSMLKRSGGPRPHGMGLFLRCGLGSDGHVHLEPSFTHEVRTIPFGGKGEWHVEQRDDSGHVLSCFALRFRRGCGCGRSTRVRQVVPRARGAETLAFVHDGRDRLVEPFGEPPPLHATAQFTDDSLEVEWQGADDVWVVLQGYDRSGVWRGLRGRTRDRCITLPSGALYKRRYSRLRLLGVRRLATAVVELPYQPPEVVAGGSIIVKIVAPHVIKGWVVGDDGAEQAPLVWSDERGTEIGRGHTLDLRGRKRYSLVRVAAPSAGRYVPPRAIALGYTQGRPSILRDASTERPHGPPVAAHPSKPPHRH